MITGLTIENLRCFRGRTEVNLAPLTFLVGENSTGKTTFLAACRLATDLVYHERRLNFNEEPFNLGTFEQMVSRVGDGADEPTEITFGIRWAPPEGADLDTGEILVRGSFRSEQGQPQLFRQSVDFDGWQLQVEHPATRDGKTVVALRGQAARIQASTSLPFFDMGLLHSLPWVYTALLESLGSESGTEEGDAQAFTLIQAEPSGRESTVLLNEVNQSLRGYGGYGVPMRPRAGAPIREHPHRTYDPARSTFDPEGGHVPRLLEQMAANGGPTDWVKVKKSLEQFGGDSGLFQQLIVHRFDDDRGSPFQIRVDVDGLELNLVDVGYGVSQALPVLVDSLTYPGPIMLQQPEVHLHPKAQAQMGSFLADLASDPGSQVLVETHSDHMIDRVRLNIRDGQTDLRPEQVRILYFERREQRVEIFELGLDKRGNVLGAPPSYRDFFAAEDRRFWGEDA